MTDGSDDAGGAGRAAGAPEPPRHAAVRWLSPTELARTGVTVALGTVVDGYADKRDVMSGATFEQPAGFDHRGEVDADGSFWFDFVSDTGDGFAAAATVATLLGRPSLKVGTEDLPRGRVLLMGGDEVYPVGDVVAYEERLEAPLDAQFVLDGPDALDGTAGADPPTLYAVPGNHDWYDGLTAFLRIFCQGRHLAAWRTAQRRSYWALRLPYDWWVLAIDIQLDGYIDETQLIHFRRVVAAMDDDARIVLMTATPAWYHAGRGDDGALDRLTFFLREILGGTAHRVRVVLTGDSHHYARYSLRRQDGPDGPDGTPGSGEEQVLVTAGHGGAYTSATHFLPDTLEVTRQLADPTRRTDATHTYVRAAAALPSTARSAAEAWRVLDRLPTRNRLLVPLLGAVQALVAGTGVLGAPTIAVLTMIAIALGSWAFAAPARPGAGRKLAFGLGLGVGEIAVSVAALAATHAVVDRTSPWWADVGVLAAVVVVGGLASGLVLSLYLLVASRLGANRNELFAAQSIEDHKGFLRLCLRPDGELVIHPLGVDRVPRRWTWRPGARPRWTTDEPLEPRLLEDPVRVRP